MMAMRMSLLIAMLMREMMLEGEVRGRQEWLRTTYTKERTDINEPVVSKIYYGWDV